MKKIGVFSLTIALVLQGIGVAATVALNPTKDTVIACS